MENNINFCPLTNSDCRRSCSWFLSGLKQCAIVALAEAIDDMDNVVREIKAENDDY